MLGYTIEDSIDRLEKRMKKVEESGGGGASSWNQLTGKPFNTVDSDTLSTDSNQLAVKAVPDDKIILSSGFEMPTLSEELTYLENEAISLDQDVEGIYQNLNHYVDQGFLSNNLYNLDIDYIKSINTDGVWTGDTYRVNGLTFIHRTDNSFKVNGTATANTTFYFMRRAGSNRFELNGGLYYLSGCSGGSASTYSMAITQTIAGQSSELVRVFNNTEEFFYSGLAYPYGFFFSVREGVDFGSGKESGIILAPMISYYDTAEYTPYVPSNKELAVRIDSIGNNYLAEETVIGSFLGKPLYRNVIPSNRTTATSANNWNSIADAPPDIDRVTHFEFLRVTGAIGTVTPQYSRVYNGKIDIYATFTLPITTFTDAYIILEYTKSTD